MATDGTLNYDVRADTKGFDGPLSKANGMISGMGRGLAGLVGPALALAGVAGGISLIGKALGGAAEVERLGIAFEVMTGSAEKGKKLLDDIRQMGSATPYEFPALAEGGKTLLNFGIAAENVIPTLSMLGDVAGGDNEKMRSLSVVYGQIASTGRLMGQDLLQLINTGFNPLNVISQKTGESMADLKKRMEDGGISSDEVADAFRIATSEGGMFFGMMDKQAGTSLGLLSTLKDTINETFTTLGTPINDALKPLLQGAIDMVGQVGLKLQAAVAIGQAAMAQGKLGELLGTALKIGAMEGVNYLVGGFTYSIKILDRLMRFSFNQAASFFTGEFTNAFTGLSQGLGLIFLGVGDLIQAALGTPFQTIVANFQAGLQFAIDKLLEGLGSIPILGDKLGLADFKGQSFSDLLSQAMGANDPAAIKAQGEASIKAGIETMGTALMDGAAVVGTNFEKAFEGMEAFQPGKVFDSAELKSQLAGLAKTLDPKAFDALLGAINGTAAPLKKAVEKAAGAIAAPAAAAGATGAGPAIGTGAESDAPGKKKIRLYNVAETGQRRYDRMSDVDKAKFAGGTRLGSVTASNSLLGRGNPVGAAFAAASGATPAMTPPPRRGAAAKPQEKTAESQLLAVLKEIATNTGPLKQLATA